MFLSTLRKVVRPVYSGASEQLLSPLSHAKNSICEVNLAAMIQYVNVAAGSIVSIASNKKNAARIFFIHLAVQDIEAIVRQCSAPDRRSKSEVEDFRTH